MTRRSSLVWSLVLGLGLPLLASSAAARLWTGLTAQTSGLTPISPGRNTYDRHQNLLQARNEVWLTLSRQSAGNHASDNHASGNHASGRQMRLGLAQIQAVMAHDIARINEGKGAGQVLQAIAVQVRQDRLRTVTRLNLGAIEVSEMRGSGRVALLQRLKRLPMFAQSSLVVAIEGAPVIRDANNLGLDQVQIEVGNFRWTMAEAADYLQVPQSYIEDIIRRELSPMGTFTDITLGPEGLVLTGEATAW